MNWEHIIKNDFKEIDDFIKEMKTINLMAQQTYKEFESEKSIEMQNLATSIIDMGEAIKELENMRNKQEDLQ
tara:strand:- start:12182 stop:12397 length:216 start_codon:yes stop_codon:yes gene_type:complete